MFARLRIIGRNAGRLLRTLILALLGAIAGCDTKPQWRGAGTDTGDARQASNPDAPPGSDGHVAVR